MFVFSEIDKLQQVINQSNLRKINQLMARLHFDNTSNIFYRNQFSIK